MMNEKPILFYSSFCIHRSSFRLWCVRRLRRSFGMRRRLGERGVGRFGWGRWFNARARRHLRRRRAGVLAFGFSNRFGGGGRWFNARARRHLRRRRAGLLAFGFSNRFGGGGRFGRRDDFEQRVIVRVQITRRRSFDLRGANGEKVFQLGVEELWVAIVKRVLGDALRAIHS